MKKFLPLLLLFVLPLGFTSCEDDPWEEEMMGEYWSDDANSVFFVLRTNKTGFIEYGDGSGFEFSWFATPRYITFTMLGYGSKRWKCEYRWSRGGELVIYDFDEWGDLHLWPHTFYRAPQQGAPKE